MDFARWTAAALLVSGSVALVERASNTRAAWYMASLVLLSAALVQPNFTQELNAVGARLFPRVTPQDKRNLS